MELLLKFKSKFIKVPKSVSKSHKQYSMQIWVSVKCGLGPGLGSGLAGFKRTLF